MLDTFIVSQSLANRTLQPLFHTGKQLTPTYEIASSSFGLRTVLSTSGTLAPIEALDNTKPATGSFETNTLIKVNQEKMRITNYYENNNTTYLELTRGLFNTPQVAHNQATVVETVLPTFIYSYDSVLRRETTISNAKVWVEETANIYYTDAFGAVYSGSSFNT